MLVVVALFFLGGEVLNTFALTLIIGIIIGTYSSIYVAAPIVVIWKDFQDRRKLAVVPARRPRPAARRSPAEPLPQARRRPSGLEEEERRTARTGAVRVHLPALRPLPLGA